MKSKFGFLSLLSRLGKDKHASSPRSLARLLRDEEGSYLLYMTIAIPVFIGFAALATEGSLLFYNHRTLQSAADSAAYSAALAYSNNTSISSADLTTHAEAIFVSYGFKIGTGYNEVNVPAPTITKPYGGVATNTAITVTATRPQLPILSSLWVKTGFNVGGNATAIVSGSGLGPGNCLLALGNTNTGNNAQSAIKISGGGGSTLNINMPGCGAFSDSTNCSGNKDAIDLNGSFRFYAGSVGTAGCLGIAGSGTIGASPQPSTCTDPATGAPLCTDGYTQGDGTIADPYAGTTTCASGPPCIPTTGSAGSCIVTATSLCPGVYTNLQLKGGTFTLQPGIYVLKSTGNKPAFEVGPGGGGTTVTGDGVTLVFTGTYPSGNNKPEMLVDSLSTLHLTAPCPTCTPATGTGLTDGFVIMGNPAMPLDTIFDISANPNSTFNGIVWLPKGDLTWGGNASTGSDMCLQIIANTVQLHGNTSLSNTGCDSTAGGLKPIGSIVTLVN